MAANPRRYRVLAGINYPVEGKFDEQRAEPGDIVEDIPPSVVELWLEQGVIEAVT